MSNIKFSENLFLGVQELERFQKFMDNDGFKRHFLLNTDSFGLIRQANLPNIGNISVENNFYVYKAGTPTDQVVVSSGLAIDSNGNLILNQVNKNLSIPNDSAWYWIKIKYEQTSIEKGTVSIDNLGNVTGTNTEFINILRGQPNFPSKIKFVNSINGNADEYEVVKVVDDTHIILQGDFTAESNLQFSVIGTFTPGFVVDNANKNIFKYDSFNVSLVLETDLNEAPTYILNEEFYIARVRNNGVNLSLQDKRVQWWQTEATNELNSLDRAFNSTLIGVENAKWDIPTSTRAKNWIELAWGFRFESWTLDTSAKNISILIGQGGVYKDTSYFQNGDFNDWRIYSKNGKYQTIIDSIKTGTQIVITLDVLDPDDYDIGDLLFVTPAYEEIEIRLRSDAAILDTNDANGNSNTTEPFPFPNVTEIFNFSINTPLARFQVPAQKDSYKYNLTYRYKIFNSYSDWQQFPDDTVGFYKEKSFDQYGNLNPNPIDRERSPYVGEPENGFITIVENPYSFDIFQNIINTGDLLGVNTTQFSNSDPLINLRVSGSKKYQHFINTNNTVFNLGSDFYINLRKFKDEAGTLPCREGNEFLIHIEQFLELNTFRLRIVEDYVNPTSFNLITELTANDIAYIKNNSNNSKVGGLMIRCTFSEQNKWIAQLQSDIEPKGAVKMLINVPSNAFDSSSNLGIISPYFGWRKITGSDDAFPVVTSDATQTGDITGSNTKTISKANLPNYNLTGSTSSGGNHQHAIQGSTSDNGDVGDKATTAPAGFWGVMLSEFGGEHSHTVTMNSGGSGQAMDIKPKNIKFLFIEKIV